MKRRVVVTGMGAVCAIGNTLEEVLENARNGVCGIRKITHYDADGRKAKVAGEVRNFHPEEVIDESELRKMDRCTQFAVYAAEQAVRQAFPEWTPADAQGGEASRTDSQEDRSRFGVLVGSGIGGISSIEENHSRGIARGDDRVSPFFIPMAITNMAAGLLAIRYGFTGSCSAVVTACASGANAIGEAFHRIRDGYEDVMLTGGTEAAITSLCMGGFSAMKALSPSDDPARASIPFDKERSGFVMGEGAGMLILEELEHAKNRGAVILGEVAGYGANCDAHHMTAPLADGTRAAQCIGLALSDAGITPEKVGYVNAHGTSTHLNDAFETRAIRNAFGSCADSLKVSSTKSMTGHMLGASAALEAILTIDALQRGFAPPTIGYQVPDPECDLDIVPNHAAAMDAEYAISNSFGFGGHNAVLALRRWTE